ncbi:NADH dehydrogenase subunit I M [Streptomyces laurentii]|uniref:NADH dehydrogenase subunit I M n=1 Tax=Streptomyces laurentii TaxID=39478 RepID=A0A160P1R1_STRLU|nr:NADH dehydrogenase subunit I M [Streptomyces laurentii]
MIDISEPVMQLLLALIVAGPFLGAVAALLPAPPGLKGRSPEQAVLRHGVTVTGVILLAAIVLALGFDHDRPQAMQATTDVTWIKALDVRIHLGVDGISLPLLLLTALLTFLCALYSYFKPPAGPSPGPSSPCSSSSNPAPSRPSRSSTSCCSSWPSRRSSSRCTSSSPAGAARTAGPPP